MYIHTVYVIHTSDVNGSGFSGPDRVLEIFVRIK